MQKQPIDLIARVCHEVNRVVQLEMGETPSKPWDEASHADHTSSRLGVAAALAGETPEQLHLSWVRNKINDGWSYGPYKSEELRQHPCIVDYEELPAEQQMKDVFFHAVVNAFKDHLDGDHK